jgi:tetratricopeptide (TPR) repeat protein
VALVLLKGENLKRAGDHEAAITFLEAVQKNFTWSEPVARLLATVYTAAGQSEAARVIYGELIQRCQSCHSRVDPLIKHNFAELSFAAGQRDTQLLELYLSLAQEAPTQAAIYFQRVGSIYAEQGHVDEAARFEALARQATDSQPQTD